MPAAPASTTDYAGFLTPISVVPKRKRKSMDPEVADSPRNHMSVKELGDLLSNRGMSKTGTKAELVKRLAIFDHNMSRTALKSRLTGHGANTEGSRLHLTERLVQCEVGASAWGQKNAGGVGVKRSVSASAEVESGVKRAKVDLTAGANQDGGTEGEERVRSRRDTAAPTGESV